MKNREISDGCSSEDADELIEFLILTFEAYLCGHGERHLRGAPEE